MLGDSCGKTNYRNLNVRRYGHSDNGADHGVFDNAFNSNGFNNHRHADQRVRDSFLPGRGGVPWNFRRRCMYEYLCPYTGIVKK